MSKEVKRYDCTDGGARFCQGCYTMSECEFGEYVSWDDYEALLAENESLRGLYKMHQQTETLEMRDLRAERDALKKDAERYRWLRNPDQDVALVIDKVTGGVPADEFGCGGYRTYEYRAGEELDTAIDTALQGEQP